MTRIEKAIELFNKGFQTKADQKRALELVSRSYEIIRSKMMHKILDLRKEGEYNWDTEEERNLYYDFPMCLAHYRIDKHSLKYLVVSHDDVKEIERLVELRNEIKSAPIVKIVSESKQLEEKAEKIEKSLYEIFKTNMEQYERGLEIGRLFNGLPVTVTPHWVFRDGGQFIRYFYFLAGKLTALNTIMTVAQTLEDEKENTPN